MNATTDLSIDAASTYAAWFATLSDPTRVQILHAVACAASGLSVGEIAAVVGIGQPTCSHHLKRLAADGFVSLSSQGTRTVVSVNPACCTGLPHAAEAVMGSLATRPCCPEDVPPDVTVRAMTDHDWKDVREIYADGIATGNATFETTPPSRSKLDRRWLPGHRWIAEIDGGVVGWASATPVSDRECYRGVAETSVYVSEQARGRRVGVALIDTQVRAADADDIWTLQATTFPENRASIRLHTSAGFRMVGVRERIAVIDGEWRDTVLLERRRA